MLAWESTTPKGQIWKVIATIVNSDLFRSQSAASQKIKTPLEFTVSAIRALRSSTNGTGTAGSFSAYTDGYAIPSPLLRMGGMDLFNRDFPDGYSEFGSIWMSASTLAERTRWARAGPGQRATATAETINRRRDKVLKRIGLTSGEI